MSDFLPWCTPLVHQFVFSFLLVFVYGLLSLSCYTLSAFPCLFWIACETEEDSLAPPTASTNRQMKRRTGMKDRTAEWTENRLS